MLIDTHAHIHSADYGLDQEEALAAAKAAGITRILCVGTDEHDSRLAVDFAAERPECFASVGLHPHDAKLKEAAFEELKTLATAPKVVAIGECGLDYYYNNSPRKDQLRAFRFQIELALQHSLPLIFHVREAFDDFFKIIDEYKGVRGVVHSFTGNTELLDRVLARGLSVGLNGIMTFTKEDWQLEMARTVPLERLLLETDSPFLTPVPKRGTINQPSYVFLIAKFLAELRDEPVEEIGQITSRNASALFGLN